MKRTALISMALGAIIAAGGAARRAEAASMVTPSAGVEIATRASEKTPDLLAQNFITPPASAKPWVYWFWMNGNITRAGITADLEAMQRVGIGGVLIMEVNQGTPAGPAAFMSPQWQELFKFALKEADRLSLQVSLNNGAGCTGSGGPWITPDRAMQKLVWSEASVQGPRHFEAGLPQPATSNDFYRDIAVLAFPTDANDARPTAGQYPRSAKDSSATQQIIHRDRVREITPCMDDQGRVSWDVPAGKWTILRIGHTPTGIMNHAAPDAGLGLECDKLSREAMDLHFGGCLGKLIDDAGPLAGKTWTMAHIDSWEAQSQDWTPKFREEFKARRGYDPLLLLPIVTGRVIQDRDVTDRFLHDFHRTIADLIADNYAGHLRELSAAHGMKLSIEAYGQGPFDSLQYAGRADVPMSGFWIGGDRAHAFQTCKAMASAAHINGEQVAPAEAFTSTPTDDKWTNHPYSLKALGDSAFCEGANRFVIHGYAMQPWTDPSRAPGMTMGPQGLHYERTQTWWEQSKPWHEYLARCQHLLQQGVFFADLCYVQSEGAPSEYTGAASLIPAPPAGYDFDICSTEAVLTRMSVKNGRIVLPDGMSYRVLVLPQLTAITPPLLRKIRELVNDGATVIANKPSTSPSLTGYPRCDEEVKKLADEMWGDCDGKTVREHDLGDGKIVWGESAEEVLSRMAIDRDFSWRAFQRESKLSYIHRKIEGGDCYFVSNQQPRDEAAECTFRITGKVPELWHPDTGIIERAPIWRSSNGTTTLPIRFDPAGSVFVVFREPADGLDHVTAVTRDGNLDPFADISCDPDGTLHLNAWQAGNYAVQSVSGTTTKVLVENVPLPLGVPGPWEVTFPPKMGPPPRAVFDKLVSWSEHSDSGIRHFSGMASYTRKFSLPADVISGDHKIFLDLGQVQVIALVTLNGKDLGILWKPPFRVDTTGALKPGDNTLQIKVVNLWANRLIGDEDFPSDSQWTAEKFGSSLQSWPKWLLDGKQSPTGRHTFTTWKLFQADTPLLESGLIGPVRLITAVDRTVN